MSDLRDVKIYGKPNFKLIVALFAICIVGILIAGWVFLRSDVLKMRSTPTHRTGMVLVLPQSMLR